MFAGYVRNISKISKRIQKSGITLKEEEKEDQEDQEEVTEEITAAAMAELLASQAMPGICFQFEKRLLI